MFLADEDLVLFVDGGEDEEGGHLAQDANGAHPTGMESGTKLQVCNKKLLFFPIFRFKHEVF